MINRHLNDFKAYLEQGLSPELKPIYEVAIAAQIKVDAYKNNDLNSKKAVNMVLEEGMNNIIAERDSIFQSKADATFQTMESIKKKYEVVFTDSEIARRSYELTLFTNKLNFSGHEYAEKLVNEYSSGELELNIDQLYVLGNYLNQNNPNLAGLLTTQMAQKNAEEPYLSDPEYVAAAMEYNKSRNEIGNLTLNFSNGPFESAILVIDQLLE
ncbi:hypothetical protein [Paenibacillus sp. FSL H8-0034]|uniref:hypothetical protein n=1 Tax=Paenibacillus sp. FSL H8-0034 TaxID=2954671 RepID=UPI0030FCC7BD